MSATGPFPLGDICHFLSVKQPQVTAYNSKPTARVLAIGFEPRLQGEYFTIFEGLVPRYFADL